MLEPRIMLYAATGNAWAAPQKITISFEADGTNLGGVANNLNATFNGNSALASKWKTEILRAAQTWSKYTNINFVVINDSGVASGSGSYQQGDPTMGDIRIGGYKFGNTSLARAYMPPSQNNYSIAGDIVFNTGITFGIGTGNDLFTIAAHEIGHALGLDHSSVTSSEMYSTYNGVKSTFSTDDIAGIRNIYSGNAARSADSYFVSTANTTLAKAADLTSTINATTKASVINNLDITNAGEVHYFKFTAPIGSASTMSIGVQSTDLSLLSPKVTVYAANGTTVLGTATGLNQYGTKLTVSVTGVAAGASYYVAVTGADTTAFGIGRYALTLNLGTGATPAVTLPVTTKANGSPLSGGGGVADGSGIKDDFANKAIVITNISPDNGVSTVDRLTNTRTIRLTGIAPIGNTVTVTQNGVVIGSALATTEYWTLNVPTLASDGQFTYVATAKDVLGTVQGTSDAFIVTIDTVAPAAPVITGFTPINGVASGSLTNAKQVTLSGTAEINNTVQIFRNGTAIGTTQADGTGKWSFAVTNNLADGTYNFTASATDLAGNAGAVSSTLTITVQTALVAPKINSVSLVTNTDGTQSLVIVGIAPANSTVQVFLNGKLSGTATVNASGNWTYKLTAATFAAGKYTFTAKATDAVGNLSGQSSPFDFLKS